MMNSKNEDDDLAETLKVRMSSADAHYGGGLVDGSKILQLFGDVATALLIKHDRDEGLFRAYTSIDFLKPVFAGDYLKIHGRITEIGRSSRKMEFQALKYIRNRYDLGATSAEFLDEPILVVKATGVCVVPSLIQKK